MEYKIIEVEELSDANDLLSDGWIPLREVVIPGVAFVRKTESGTAGYRSVFYMILQRLK